jgi:hypothetical protein
VSEPVLQYNYRCPSCSGSFSISIDRIPPVRARFPCAKCGEPMDFPSREQAQMQAKLQMEAKKRETAEAELEKTAPLDRGEKVFRVDKRGWEDDFLDRRATRNLIRTGEIVDTDHVFTGDGKWLVAGELPELKPLFDLKRKSKFTPPRCCRTHTDRVAHFFCRDTDRPLCEECAPEKKFGANMMRVCGHCGGTITDAATAATLGRQA